MRRITVFTKLLSILSLNHISPIYLCFFRPEFGSVFLIDTVINYSFVYKQSRFWGGEEVFAEGE